MGQRFKQPRPLSRPAGAERERDSVQRNTITNISDFVKPIRSRQKKSIVLPGAPSLDRRAFAAGGNRPNDPFNRIPYDAPARHSPLLIPGALWLGHWPPVKQWRKATANSDPDLSHSLSLQFYSYFGSQPICPEQSGLGPDIELGARLTLLYDLIV